MNTIHGNLTIKIEQKKGECSFCVAQAADVQEE